MQTPPFGSLSLISLYLNPLASKSEWYFHSLSSLIKTIDLSPLGAIRS